MSKFVTFLCVVSLAAGCTASTHVDGLSAGLSSSTAQCTNGSITDCNPAGATTPGSEFVDPNPPTDFVQCAGFTNRSVADDVRWDWENNCIPFKDDELWLRVFNSDGSIFAGARLIDPRQSLWNHPTGRWYDATDHEGRGLSERTGSSAGHEVTSGVTLAFHESDIFFCGCRTGACSDIYTATRDNQRTIYASGRLFGTHEVHSNIGRKGTCGDVLSTRADFSVAFYGRVQNRPPTITCVPELTLEADPKSCVANHAVGVIARDPDGDPLTIRSSPPGPYSIGTTAVTTTAADPSGASASCITNVTVVDVTPPQLKCAVTPVCGDLDEDEGEDDANECDEDEVLYRPHFSKFDCSASRIRDVIVCGAETIEVAVGQLVEFEQDDGECSWHENKDGVLEIEGPSARYVVTTADQYGNVSECSVDIPSSDS